MAFTHLKFRQNLKKIETTRLGSFQYLLELVEGLAAGKQSAESVVRNKADDTIPIE